MAREPRVDLRNHLDGGPHARRVRVTGVERPVSQVLIDVPDILPAGLGGSAQQSGTMAIQTEGGQPAARDQVVALGDGGLQALDHQRTHFVVNREAQAINAGVTRRQLLLLDQPARHGASSQQLAQAPAQFGHARLLATVEQIFKPFDHVHLRA